ncbi:cytochrome-c oxidase [Photorhabdus laumondii subsp. laumondii]|uniref:Photorhabdus luminescens subsp. laumondii TTO1 complete genome segment 8/17 n=4 Tax=Photorhabdus TaxID=29487 RepID=Q7N4K1_PHOLL|nr:MULTISPECIES: cytochrome-c oxidase [Photorhabdus]AWK42096.1 cytochrome-c oxidase [Photorhabdus laumondii subsp. laumondii]AXG42963.1 cytochrome-c oxidase [Photorhabdus laumondii subsp. laumondii]AXG47421.1 cytochrome-c oxidase [Photorhabdus laumondii subsp. laumondii]MCC8383586.1 cytochrome-c oxidase [Photorhabdus laumondii]MCC8415352.1 cytochrome-c oxidase [Photorhabdus laumondii]
MDKSLYNSESTLKSYLGIGNEGVSDNLLAVLKSNCVNYQSSVKKFIELLEYIQNNNIRTKPFNELVALHELVAPHDCAVVSMLSIHYNLAIGTVANLGVQTPYVEDLYQKLCSGRAIGVYLATELAHGNDLIAIETQANYLPEKGVFMLNSPSPNAYKFMPNTMPCELPKVAVILAQLNVSGKKYGIFPFLLPLSVNGKLTPGVKITPLGDKPGFYLDNAITSFDNVEIPFEGLLAGNMITLTREGKVSLHIKELRERFSLITNRIHSGKLCMAMISVTAAKSVLHITSTYGNKRQTFGYSGAMPIINYSHFKEGIAWDTLSTITHTLYLRELTRKVSTILSESIKNFKFSDELLIEIITTKSLCTWRTQEILINCRERCGAQGLFTVNKISPYLISNFGTITSEGDNLVLSLKAGGMIILNKMKEINKASFQHNLFPILHDYMNFLYKKLNGLIASNNKKINLDILNKHSGDFLELSQTYAVLSVVTTTIDAYHDNNDDDLCMIIEGYLLDWIHRNMSNLLRSEVINLQESKKIDERRIEYIRQHADRINDYIPSFGVDKAGIETPISSDDYISWYANNHHQLKNN